MKHTERHFKEERETKVEEMLAVVTKWSPRALNLVKAGNRIFVFFRLANENKKKEWRSPPWSSSRGHNCLITEF